jgi:hypothetical protein
MSVTIEWLELLLHIQNIVGYIVVSDTSYLDRASMDRPSRCMGQ